MKLYFRSVLKKEVKAIDISKLDFSKNTSVQYLDIHTDEQEPLTMTSKILRQQKIMNMSKRDFRPAAIIKNLEAQVFSKN